MCGRYVQTKRARDLAHSLTERQQAEAPRPETWNLAPSTPSLTVRGSSDGLTMDWLSWGFDAGATPLKPINARIETAATKLVFRVAWRTHRCVVPADGWYEWRTENGRKQPYFFHRRDGEPIFFAGLWAGNTFCLLTTAADGDLTRIHDRRPLALPADKSRRWIEDVSPEFERVVASAVPAREIGFYPVGTQVSSPRNDGPNLIVEAKVNRQPTELDLFPNPA